MKLQLTKHDFKHLFRLNLVILITFLNELKQDKNWD